MKTSRYLSRTSLAGCIAILLAVSADAATLTVTSDADAGGTCPGADCTLRQAIAAAAPNDTINFAAGITTVTLTSAGLVINKNLTISGPGANLLSVRRDASAGNFFRIFTTSAVTTNIITISGLTISGGTGGIFINPGSTLFLNNSTISGNLVSGDTGSGGGIFNTSVLTAIIYLTHFFIGVFSLHGHGKHPRNSDRRDSSFRRCGHLPRLHG